MPDTPLSALMGPGSHHEGDLTFEGRVRVDGHFTGRLYSEDILEIGATGTVDGEADVARCVLAGRFVGRLRVRERLRIESTGSVEGSLDVGILELHAGARLAGDVRVAGKELP
jgi:cytoskeletal protein CcmA (bactofilin family)